MIEKLVGSVFVLVGILLAICHHSHETYLHGFIQGDNNELIQSRQKRLSDDEALDRSNCSVTCSQLLVRSFAQTFPKQDITDPNAYQRFFLDNYDANNTAKACKFYNRTKACFNTCSNKESMKAFLIGDLSALDVFCVSSYNDVKKDMACASIHLRRANITCTPKCKKYHVSNIEWETINLDEKEAFTNKSRVAIIKTTLTKSCLFIKCVNTCVKPIVTNACNVSAGNTLEKLFIGAFQSVQSVVKMVDSEMKANNITNIFPIDCKKMGPLHAAAPKYWFMI